MASVVLAISVAAYLTGKKIHEHKEEKRAQHGAVEELFLANNQHEDDKSHREELPEYKKQGRMAMPYGQDGREQRGFGKVFRKARVEVKMGYDSATFI
ncbi:hypothetical protein EK21DRAFT_111862 [Setomelanomma holmii]|uniref:Uncharacterized protein n=1 Tax=Setomelanomma holmii TaxID=210430 RepID=A0A9P4H9G5_9PLEO|nr:hypothetical protein EK21DRAFT_111862 [Setomelanomma holmii]